VPNTNSFIVITKLFNKLKCTRFTQTIQNLDKSYRSKFFLKEAREGLHAIVTRQAIPHSDDTMFERV